MVAFKVQCDAGYGRIQTTISIHEKHIHCPMAPIIKFQELKQIIIRKRSLHLQCNGTIFNLIVKDPNQRDEILMIIIQRCSSIFNRTHWQIHQLSDTEAAIIMTPNKQRVNKKRSLRTEEKCKQILVKVVHRVNRDQRHRMKVVGNPLVQNRSDGDHHEVTAKLESELERLREMSVRIERLQHVLAWDSDEVAREDSTTSTMSTDRCFERKMCTERVQRRDEL